jgi:hypothetical protein
MKRFLCVTWTVMAIGMVALAGCEQEPTCEIPFEECPEMAEPLADLEGRCEQVAPGSFPVLKRPDVCTSYPFGEDYQGAVTCGRDPVTGCGQVAEIWCIVEGE